MTSKKKAELQRQRDLEKTAMELSQIRGSLEDAYAHFNNSTDPDSLDACIYEISALRSRYNSTLKHYRERFY